MACRCATRGLRAPNSTVLFMALSIRTFCHSLGTHSQRPTHAQYTSTNYYFSIIAPLCTRLAVLFLLGVFVVFNFYIWSLLLSCSNISSFFLFRIFQLLFTAGGQRAVGGRKCCKKSSTGRFFAWQKGFCCCLTCLGV